MAILSGLLSARPTDNAPTNKGRLYLATDTGLVYRDTGSDWERYAVLLVEDYLMPATALHVEAPLDDLIDEIYRESRRLGTTRVKDVVSGGNFVVSAGRSVIVRR